VAAPTERAGGGLVRLRDQRVLSLRAGRAGETAEARARAASTALEQAVQDSPSALAAVEVREDVAVIHVGRVVILEVGPEDVAEEKAQSLVALGQSYAADIDRALKAERRRIRLSDWVFDVSLLVFSGLITFLLLGKVGEIERRAGAWMGERPGRMPALTVHRVEVVSPEAMARVLATLLRFGRYLLQLAVVYAWLVFSLSLFPVTRGAGLTLGKVVLAPATNLVSRMAGYVPALLGAALAGAVLWLALRALRLFFQSVADGETHVGWLPADLAVPVGELVRLALVVLAAVFAAPILTGSDQGTLAQVGSAALLALALGIVPALANVAAGIPRLFRRTYRSGQLADVGGSRGVVRTVDLLHVELEDARGDRLLVPHLAALFTVTRLPREAAAVHFELSVAPDEDQVRVLRFLLEAGGPATRAELVRLDAHEAVYRVAGSRSDLAVHLANALQAASIRLGQGPSLGAR